MTTSPLKASEEGRNKRNPLRPDWENIKNTIMKKAVKSKFFQHHDLKIILLNTGDRLMVEHTSNDAYWADGGDGAGKNMLGVLLMEVRRELSSICSSAEWVLPPWVAFPEIDQFDMFWRMGLGENYMYIWAKWFSSQSLNSKKKYEDFFPNPSDWDKFYDGCI